MPPHFPPPSVLAWSSCAAAPEKRAQVVFKEVTSAQLETAAGTIARTLLGLLEQETSMTRRCRRWIGYSEKLASERVPWLVQWQRSIRLDTV